jgi:hypothetical protein
MMKTATTKYTLVVRPTVNIDFDKHGNCREHTLAFDSRAEYVYDNETDEAFSVSELPAEVKELIEDYIETLDLVRFFQPGPEPDAPF